ncbi:Eco57I restriction-modification methylase domain-containing protein [Erythrobacter sp. SDW2]|uniref:Eco57I restriction-modification methylase domain-containing protein n=1 Tax=Erythrobacter sp. SDW2 TaxID=2907154 RepID=UPI001F3445DE|nr:Eco57I restriction-modification methylase domain-containing protein [Erythrobacter sp. SDW2]UIP07190.1 Eco57I restriction-modification methylase domain-containing protein [Erythrobacter sp. SDW2]
MTTDFSQLRHRCGLEVQEVASEFGEPLETVFKWECGEVSPPDRVLRSLSIMADFSSKPTTQTELAVALLERPETPTRLNPAMLRQRKSQLGQFMTPPNVAEFMASLFEFPAAPKIRLLDAGAGRGALTAAFVERAGAAAKIAASAFEFDDQILPDLREQLATLRQRVNVDCELIEGDFIEDATNRICLGKGTRYSHAILNPPYKKISNDSRHRALLSAAGLETVNLYSGFVGLALELLEEGGELVAIIPRSFCNGPYYQPFRRFLLRRAAIRHIHLFDARNKAFKDDGVLQENIIIKLVRGAAQSTVTVSASTDDSFADYSEKRHDFARIVFPHDADAFIHIPTGDDDQILERASFGHSLADLGLSVSTGPVVDFRLREDLRADPERGTVPLLYPGHFNGTGVQWPKPGFKKPNAIRDTMTTRKWLYPNGFYTVVRRFSSKEERRRIVANVIDPTRLPAQMIGIENHLNVFHVKRQPIPEELAHGLATYLAATAVDTYFRRFNGHTQVNATDLRAMRYPSREALFVLGKWAKGRASISQEEIDERVDAL